MNVYMLSLCQVLNASDSELGSEDDTDDIHGQNGSSAKSKPKVPAKLRKMFKKRFMSCNT